MTLVVEEDSILTQHSMASTDVLEKTTNLESNPIDQEKFGEYVAGLHLRNNKAFEIQYKVCYCMLYSYTCDPWTKPFDMHINIMGYWAFNNVSYSHCCLEKKESK